MPRERPTVLVLTCEHAGNRVPTRYAPLFRGHEALLASHRGWDPGALPLARFLARELRAPLLFTSVTRLLVEPNRSLHHRALFSTITRSLPASEKDLILARWYTPHRDDVNALMERRVKKGGRVIHVGVHTFTPILDGEPRRADIGLLYDPRRTQERQFCVRWAERLADIDPHLCVRRNYPYRGASDGLTTALRRLHPGASYLGVELEVNQSLAASPDAGMRRSLHRVLAGSLRQAMGA